MKIPGQFSKAERIHLMHGQAFESIASSVSVTTVLRLSKSYLCNSGPSILNKLISDNDIVSELTPTAPNENTWADFKRNKNSFNN